MPPYLLERQTEYWTSRAVEEYFLDAGFELHTFPLSQLSERHLPVDFLFYSGHHAKLFGLQYKRLYGNGEDYWPIDERQRSDLLSLGGWAYYSLSELKSGRDQRLALHKQLIVAPERMPSGHRVTSRALMDTRYFRWGGFAKKLEDCTAGLRVEDEAGLRKALQPLVGRRDDELQAIVDVFVVAFAERRALHMSPFVSFPPEPEGSGSPLLPPPDEQLEQTPHERVVRRATRPAR